MLGAELVRVAVLLCCSRQAFWYLGTAAGMIVGSGSKRERSRVPLQLILELDTPLLAKSGEHVAPRAIAYSREPAQNQSL